MSCLPKDRSASARLSLLTATDLRPQRSQYLQACAQSVLPLLEALPGQMEWCLYCDTGEAVPPWLLDLAQERSGVRVLPRPASADRRAEGLFLARNELLLAARGERLMYLDDDDLLLVDQTLAALEEAEAHDSDWLACGLQELHGEQPGALWMPPLPEGPAEAGAPLRYWPQGDDALPLSLGSTLIRRRLLVASGGFPALRQAGDPAAWALLTARHPGRVLHLPLYLYRQHPDQWAWGEAWWQLERHERELVRALGQGALDPRL